MYDIHSIEIKILSDAQVFMKRAKYCKMFHHGAKRVHEGMRMRELVIQVPMCTISKFGGYFSNVPQTLYYRPLFLSTGLCACVQLTQACAS